MTKEAAATKTVTGGEEIPARKPAQAKQAKPKTAKATKQKTEKLSAIDAAAQVLANSTEPMSTKQMIEAMAQQKLWVSPGGKTPGANAVQCCVARDQRQGQGSAISKDRAW